MVTRGFKVLLRGLRSEDWRQIVEWESDEEILQYLGEKRLLTAHWAGNDGAAPASPATRSVLMRRRRVLAIDTAQGDFIGYIELRDINWRQRSAELRICIGKKTHWGQGYGTEAVNVFLHLNFSRLKLDYVFLRVYRKNTRAIRCYEKCGFTVEGILRAGAGRRHTDDIVLMGIRRHQVVGLAYGGVH